MPSLMENSFILIFAAVFNLSWYFVLGEVHKENLSSHGYVVG